MKKLIYFFAAAVSLITAGCNSDDNPKLSSDLKLLDWEAKALNQISKSLDTRNPAYPHPWDPDDMATWGGNITIDTVDNPVTYKPALAISGITLYITEPSHKIDVWLSDLRNLKELKVFACSGATFNPDEIPTGCKSFSLEKINSEEPGYIHIFDRKFDMKERMSKWWTFEKFILHGSDAKEVNVAIEPTGTLDLSHNLLEEGLDNRFFEMTTQVNLSYNRFSTPLLTWEEIMDHDNIPNLQYNDIEIPQWVTATDWWKANHEWFIGNPGYIAPKQ